MSTTQLSGDASSGQIATNLNSLSREVQNLQVTQVFKDDTGQRRVLLGKGADGFYGLKVSQEGTDVYSATDDELVFNSSQNVFKIVQSGTISNAATSVADAGAGNYSSSESVTSVAHGLSYTPAIIAYLFNNNEYYPLPSTGFVRVNATSAYWQEVSATVTDTDIKLYVRLLATDTPVVVTAGLYTVKYYLLQETAN